MERYLKNQILKDLTQKMVFLAGPRQVGKTTLAMSLAKKYDYLNWDIEDSRSRILAKEFERSELWIFDEIHKYKFWRNYLKGLYDQFKNKQKILVTGSAKLDILRRGGDSLQGRYHFLRLHPLSFSELGGQGHKDLKELFDLGGFPEPFFSSSKDEANRWSRSYRQTLVRQEIPSNELIQDLGNLELLMNQLPHTVGSPLSINSLREDLNLAHKTVAKWLDALERLYAHFRIPPFGKRIIKAVKKEQKLYLFDWNNIKEAGPRFENLIACHLLKWVHFEQDTKGRDLELRYFRDTDGREVDFVITEDASPIFFIECKTSESATNPHLHYLSNKWPAVACFQIAFNGKKDVIDGKGVRIMPAWKFLSLFPDF